VPKVITLLVIQCLHSLRMAVVIKISLLGALCHVDIHVLLTNESSTNSLIYLKNDLSFYVCVCLFLSHCLYDVDVI